MMDIKEKVIDITKVIKSINLVIEQHSHLNFIVLSIKPKI